MFVEYNTSEVRGSDVADRGHTVVGLVW